MTSVNEITAYYLDRVSCHYTVTLIYCLTGVWTKRGLGHGLPYGLGHGLPYGLPVVDFLKLVSALL